MELPGQRPSNRKVGFLLLALAVLWLGACGTGPVNVAQVGETAITGEDLAYRQAVLALRSGEQAPAHLALLQLIEEALMVEVGRAHGVEVTEEMLANEAERVQATSRDPEMLARIRDLFGEHEAAYRRLVLQPILVNQLLHARFSLGHDIQAEPLARAGELLAAAQSGRATLPELAQEFGGLYRQMEVVGGRLRVESASDQSAGESLNGSQGDELAAELEQYGVQAPDYDGEFAAQVLSGLSAGELHPKVVEDRHSFRVVRLLQRDGPDASLESVVIPKLAFEPWFQAQSQRVTLEIHDEVLQAALLAEVDVPYITDRLR